MNESAAEKFGNIYRTSEWESRSRSGPGSLPELNAVYLEKLKEVIRDHKIQSVVDIGCGDWTLYQDEFQWQDMNTRYLGVDVVPELVEKLNATYGRGNVEFRCLDVNGSELPSADLYILKDVLQHWPTDRVLEFLPQFARCRMAVVTNDIDYSSPNESVLRKLRVLRRFKNRDTSVGGYRPIRLREAPFKLPARLLLNYSMKWEGWRFDKETLLYQNDKN
jgi:SAM-dependent methyltransferase